jgi:hypothetical protein
MSKHDVRKVHPLPDSLRDSNQSENRRIGLTHAIGMAHTNSSTLVKISKPSSEPSQKDGQSPPPSITCPDDDCQEELPVCPVSQHSLEGRAIGDEYLGPKSSGQELFRIPRQVCRQGTSIDPFSIEHHGNGLSGKSPAIVLHFRSRPSNPTKGSMRPVTAALSHRNSES